MKVRNFKKWTKKFPELHNVVMKQVGNGRNLRDVLNLMEFQVDYISRKLLLKSLHRTRSTEYDYEQQGDVTYTFREVITVVKKDDSKKYLDDSTDAVACHFLAEEPKYCIYSAVSKTFLEVYGYGNQDERLDDFKVVILLTPKNLLKNARHCVMA